MRAVKIANSLSDIATTKMEHEIAYICIDTETGCHAHWQVGEKAKEEGGEGSNGGCGSDKVQSDFVDAGEVGAVG